MVTPEYAAALCAALAVLPGAATPAQPAGDKVELRAAFITEAGLGDVVVYISDEFRRPASATPEPLHMITIRRSNPGDALNGLKDDMAGLHQYLKANSGFPPKDLVAILSSRDILRIVFRGDHRAFAERFEYQRATLGEAPPGMWARLRAIAIPDFARYLVERALLQAQAERQFLGDAVPPAERRTLELKLEIDAGNEGRGRKLAAALKRKRFGSVAASVTLGPGDAKLALKARFPFSEASLPRIMKEVCADAAKSGAECVSWTGRFDPIALRL